MKKLSLIMITGVLALTSAVFAEEKVVSEAAIKKADSFIKDWDKTHRTDRKIQQVVLETVDLMSQIDAIRSHASIDSKLKKDLDKVYDVNLQSLQIIGDQASSALIREYLSVTRDRFKPRDSKAVSFTNFKALNQMLKVRYEVVENTLHSIGLKAVPALTELLAKATQAEAGLFTRRTKDLITAIARKGELDVEKAKLQAKTPEAAPTMAEVPPASPEGSLTTATPAFEEIPQLNLQVQEENKEKTEAPAKQ